MAAITMATGHKTSIFSVAFEREMFKGYIQPNNMQVLLERFNISAVKFREAKPGGGGGNSTRCSLCTYTFDSTSHSMRITLGTFSISAFSLLCSVY